MGEFGSWIRGVLFLMAINLRHNNNRDNRISHKAVELSLYSGCNGQFILDHVILSYTYIWIKDIIEHLLYIFRRVL
jgi:hypothetical protein